MLLNQVSQPGFQTNALHADKSHSTIVTSGSAPVKPVEVKPRSVLSSLNAAKTVNFDTVAEVPKTKNNSPVLRDITNVYNQTIAHLNNTGGRMNGGPNWAWFGNFLANTGLDKRKLVCAEQAEVLIKRLRAALSKKYPDMKLGLMFTKNYNHAFVVVQTRAGTFYMDPWAGTAPTPDINKIYDSGKGGDNLHDSKPVWTY